ncbi:MAG TPA: hypothetical protein VN429_01640 [Methanospirillum sp.]|uniref:hypothetical protein n=1 Tax=Methanospirillum sp. TaxID=45200 RepID=UPI002CA13D95|nr:hypothetical protein [Methanospirillum sp.]HWQ63090.1 hypothetical protein [Methanospirillum sp.]
MTEPADIRDESCTNLSILLKLLIRNINPGETIQMIATKKQLIQIEEVLSENGIYVQSSPLPLDLLLEVTKPN